MNRTELLPLALALVLATGLMGWIIWSQWPGDQVVATQAPPAQIPAAPEVPPVDEARAVELRAAAETAPEDVQVRVDLGNLYFDGQRFEDAIPWFEAALALRPDDVEVSTDLGVAYFYTDDTDRALSQFARSLNVAPAHAKTILNIGIVRAFGNQDLEGAVEAWEEVQRVAPGSPEALAATELIAAHR
jgi:tetratricopeptide (TPR) repeat protein